MMLSPIALFLKDFRVLDRRAGRRACRKKKNFPKFFFFVSVQSTKYAAKLWKRIQIFLKNKGMAKPLLKMYNSLINFYLFFLNHSNMVKSYWIFNFKNSELLEIGSAFQWYPWFFSISNNKYMTKETIFKKTSKFK